MVKKYLHELESFLEKNDTRTYHEFTIEITYFKGDSIFVTGNEMRMTCSNLF